MLGFSHTGVFSRHELSLLGIAEILVRSLPEVPGLRCHELARAVGIVLGLQVVDGKYGCVEHSWLFVPGRDRGSILDVYSVGSLPTVRLVDVFPFIPEWNLYKPGALVLNEPLDEGLVMDLVGMMQDRLL